LRIRTFFATTVISLGILGAAAGPAQAAPAQAASAGSAASTASTVGARADLVAAALPATASAALSRKAKDKKFVKVMTSAHNPDRRIYRGVSKKKMHRLGVAVCGLIKAYDADEPADDAIVHSLVTIQKDDKAPFTDKGDAYLVVAGIYVYCPKYVKTLNDM
jgi:hypothetical protein